MLTLGRVSGEGDCNSWMLTISRGVGTEGQPFANETVALMTDSTTSSLKGMFLP